MHNYQSLMGIYLAINMVYQKLSQSFKLLRPKSLSMWKRISNLMSPLDNFSHYREAIKSIEPPYIPCQEVILKDLLYHDCSIPDFIENRVWNFNKLRVIGKILHQFHKCQYTPYQYLPLKELQEILSSIPTITQAQLDELPIDTDQELKNPAGGERYRFTHDAPTDSDTTEEIENSSHNSDIIPSPAVRRSGSVGSESRSKSNSKMSKRMSNRKKAISKILVVNEANDSLKRKTLKREKIPFMEDSPNRKDLYEN